MHRKQMNYSSIGYNTSRGPRQYGYINASRSIHRHRVIHSSQKRRSLDAVNNSNHIQYNYNNYNNDFLRSNVTQIDFKKDKLAYQQRQKQKQQVNKTTRDNMNKDKNNFKNQQQEYRNPFESVYDDNLKVCLKKYLKLIQSNNDIMKNIVRQEILSQLQINDQIMKRLDKNLVESLILIGKMKIYQQQQIIAKTQNMIGFVLYGRAKIYNQDYKNVIGRGDTVGEHSLFQHYINLKIRCLEETCMFWLPLRYYVILRQQSYKNGLKQQFNQLQIILRRSFINKKYKELNKKSHV